MFAASKTAAAAAGTPPASTDPQFNYVTMLLHGDGTNGAQNNTFVDSSTNNFTITRNGTPTQGSFSPYGDLWSNQFSGSGQYLTTSSVTFAGDFTVEGWVFIANLSAARALVQIGDDLNANGPVFYVTTAGKFSIFAGSALLTGSATIAANTWVHLAVCRSGSTIKSYVNGVLDATITNSTTFTGAVRVGAEWYNGALGGTIMNGYISNLRLVTGTALYTSAFTPSTTPLTAVSGTSLLTCQSNRFRDNSSNNFAITVTGTPSVQRFSPFDPAAEYSTSVIGGSAYFNGTGDYLNVADNTALQVAAGDFTFEAWVNPRSLPSAGNYKTLWSKRTSTGGFGGALLVMDSSGNYLFFVASNSSTWGLSGSSTGHTISLNSWQHLAMVRSGNNLILYKNGVAGSTVSLAFSVYDSGPLTLMAGSSTSSQNVDGYMSNFRLIKGTAVYTANFTPPTAPLTAITNTSLLLNCVNAGIYDNAMMNDLVTVGNAQVSTAVKKYGTGSMAFDGTGDYLTTLNSQNCNFGTGDFTVETWVYTTATASGSGVTTASQYIIDARTAATTNAFILGFRLLGTGTGNLLGWYTGTTLLESSAVSINQWHHVAYTRSGTTGRLFLNGVQVATQTDSTNYVSGATITYGSRYTAENFLFGYIDDLRITKGIARYTANFTPPTAALPNN